MGSKKQKHLPHIPHSQRWSPSSVTRVGSPCLSQQDVEQTKQKGCCLFSPKQRKSDQSRNAVRLQLTNPIRPAHPIPATRQTPLLQPLHTQNTSSAGIWSKPETPSNKHSSQIDKFCNHAFTGLPVPTFCRSITTQSNNQSSPGRS